MAIKQGKTQHVVAIPYPAQGHINPMLQLCQQLVRHGFTFTFVNTHHIHQRVQHTAASMLDSDLNGHTRDLQQDAQHANGHAHAIRTHDGHEKNHALHAGIDDILSQQEHAKDGLRTRGSNPVRMVFVEGGCAPEQHAHISTSKEALLAAQAMKDPVEQLISDIVEEQPVAFVLTDILLGWGQATASKFDLPWVCFWPASAATCAAFLHFADLAKQGKTVPTAGKQYGEVPILDDVPGLPATRLHDTPKCWDITGKVSHEIVKYFHAAEKARFLLFNTFVELEGKVLQALSKRYSTLAVGPLLPARYMQINEEEVDTQARASLFREDRTCLKWLDKQAPSSVLFISFGSISARTAEQLEELAEGVEASGCPFLWVRRPDISAGSTPGTELAAQHEGKGNGLIVPWAPQLDVLSHPAVGGFITHCGWNSTMESIAMGVPMLCWADTGERLSNQRFVVEIWKCGLDMVSDSRRNEQHIDEAVLVRREEIEKSIRCLMVEEAGAPIRLRAAQLRESSILAFRDSHSQVNQFSQAMVHSKGFAPP